MNNSVRAKSNSFSLAALVFGILSVLGSFLVVFTPFSAGMALTFALLSRGDKKMGVQAQTACCLAMISVMIGLILTVLVVFLILHGSASFYYHFGPSVREFFNWI